MPNPVPTELSLLDHDVAAPALTLANKVFTYANNAFTRANPVFASANNVFTLASQLPAHQLHNPVAPTNTVFAPANNALALAKGTALLSIISWRSREYRDPQIIENKAQSPKVFQNFPPKPTSLCTRASNWEEEHEPTSEQSPIFLGRARLPTGNRTVSLRRSLSRRKYAPRRDTQNQRHRCGQKNCDQ